MDLITYIEDTIITRLKNLDLQAAVLPYPDKDFETYEPMHNNGEILVAYTGEDDGPTQDTGLIVQDRRMVYELTFVFSSLRSVAQIGGLYAHLEAVRLGLTGYKIAECTAKSFPTSIERVRRYKKRWWQYTQTWEFGAVNVEVPAEELGELLNRITIKTGDQTTVIDRPI